MRVAVRRHARDLAVRDLWPQDEAAVTALDFAQLALLRLLRLQRETRHAVRTVSGRLRRCWRYLHKRRASSACLAFRSSGLILDTRPGKCPGQWL
jgi:hypothetical protein